MNQTIVLLVCALGAVLVAYLLYRMFRSVPLAINTFAGVVAFIFVFGAVFFADQHGVRQLILRGVLIGIGGNVILCSVEAPLTGTSIAKLAVPYAAPYLVFSLMCAASWLRGTGSIAGCLYFLLIGIGAYAGGAFAGWAARRMLSRCRHVDSTHEPIK